MLGFGFTLVAISSFLVFTGSSAVQLVIIINLIVALVLSVSLWKYVPVRLWWCLVAGSLVGLPFGMFAYSAADLVHLQFAAGVFVVLFSVLAWLDVPVVPSAVRREAGRTKTWAVAVGGLAGFMATSLGMPGPVLMLFLAALELEKNVIRGTAISFLAATNALAVVFHLFVTGIPTAVIGTAGVLIPIAVVGTWGGHVLSRRLGQRIFRQALLALITLSGGYAIMNALTR